jgi:hypothetical protein
VVATLSTDDPNENGEGEPLVVESTGGFRQVIATYETPQTLAFIAAVDGETVFGNIDGGEGDESCTLTMTVNQKNFFSDQTKAELGKLSQDLWIVTGVFGTITGVCAEAPELVYSKLCALIGVTETGLSGLGAGILGRLSLDPPDPNFTVIATPVIPALPPVTSVPAATPQVIQAFNALVQNEENIIGFGNVILTCFNRARGAENAGNALWEARQIAASQQYNNQLGVFLNAEPPLRANLQSALLAEGFPTTTLNANDVLSYEMDVAANGLPAEVNSTLQALGASSADIDEVARVVIVQDTNAAAQSFPASLTDPTLMADLHAAAAALQTAGSCVPDTTTLCLNNGRFAVSATFETDTQSGMAHVVQLTPDTGYLWFFSASNAEAVVKVINGCALGSHFWVFAGGLTNVDTMITVTDTVTGMVKNYLNPANTPFQPVQDTSAFATCSAADTAASSQAAPSPSAEVVASRLGIETAELAAALSSQTLRCNLRQADFQ